MTAKRIIASLAIPLGIFATAGTVAATASAAAPAVVAIAHSPNTHLYG
jgi:hypothetical protein